MRSPSLSPSGQWIAYYVTFAADVDQNGLWLVRSDGSERQAVPDDLFGAYQWRSCPPGGECPPESLIVVPFNPDAEFHELWEFDPAAGQPKRLTDPMSTLFKIANGVWRVSPDGRYVAFVESEDRNIWVLMLP